MRKIYLAAPFFTTRELKVVEAIEQALESAPAHTEYASPRKHGGNVDLQGNIREHARAIFENNIGMMDECTECLAWLDRLLQKESQSVRIVEWNETIGWSPKSKSLEQPDLGTVWEMGYMKACAKEITGFTLKPRGEGTLNLMISESCNRILHGWDELVEFLDYNFPELWDANHGLYTWEGKVR